MINSVNVQDGGRFRRELLAVTFRYADHLRWRYGCGRLLAVGLLVMCSSYVLHAQVQVGPPTGAPPSSTTLNFTTTGKGLLPPRVSLASRTDVVTVPSPAIGLVVFNDGLGTLKDVGLHTWNGSTWSRLAQTNQTATGPMVVGQVRSRIVDINKADFVFGANGTVSRTHMNGAAVGNTIARSWLLLSDVAGVTDLPEFEGLRMDFSSRGVDNALRPSPKIVNTTGTSVMISHVGWKSTNNFLDHGKNVIAANAVSWRLAEDDSFSVTANGFTGVLETNILIHDTVTGEIRWYMATWHATWMSYGVGQDRLIVSMSVTRLA